MTSFNIWCISDTHFHHKNIIQYTNRPFNSVEEMDNQLISNWNSVVKDNDIVLFLGDFLLGRYNHKIAAAEIKEMADKLNGHKIIIKGNHDHKQVRYKDCGFDDEFYQEMSFDGLLFEHIPHHFEISDNYRYIFFGHIHNNRGWIDFIPTNALNVCVEQWNFTPINITKFFTEEGKQELVNKYLSME